MIEIKPKLYKDITEYCKLNNITDINAFIEECIRESFTAKKYGVKPSTKSVPEVKETPLETKVDESQSVVEAPVIKKSIKDRDDYSIYDN